MPHVVDILTGVLQGRCQGGEQQKVFEPHLGHDGVIVQPPRPSVLTLEVRVGHLPTRNTTPEKGWPTGDAMSAPLWAVGSRTIAQIVC